MDEQRSGRGWVRRGRRGMVVAAGFVLLFFFGSNLLMQTGWFRGKVEGRLMLKTRLVWTVDKVWWSPWGGLRARGLKAVALGPDADRIAPIVEITEVRVRPYWKELLTGTVRPREIVVTEPRGHMPLELLLQLMRADGRVDAARLGRGGAAAASRVETAPAVQEDAGEAESAAGKKESPGQQAVQAPKTAPKREAVPLEQTEPPVEPTGRLLVTGGEMLLYSVSAPEKGLQVSGLEMDVPFSGGEASGMIAASGVTFAGEAFAGPLEVPLGWKQGTIEWPASEYEWNGMTIQTAGAVRIRGRLLGTMEVRVVAPRIGPQAVPGWEALQFATGALEMRARWTGDMIRPVTWQGNVVAGVGGVQIVHSGRGETVVFERARLVADMRGGVLQVLDGTLAGESLSFLGNGLVLVDGRAYGVGRVVAAPEVAEAITRVAAGSLVSRGHVHDWMVPLGTPDRFYRDIYVQGRVPRFEFDLGPDGQWMDSERAMVLMRMFVNREEREEEAKAEAEEGDS